MKRTFLTNLSLLLFLNLLVKPFWVLGIDRSVQNIVGSADYGFYFALFNFSFLLNIFLDAGITGQNNREIAQNPNLLKDRFQKIIPIRIVLGVIYAIATITVGVALNYTSEQFHLLYVLIVNQFLLSFILYFRSNISGLHQFKKDSVLSVLDRILMIAFCSYLLWGRASQEPMQIEWFVYAQTIAYVITAVIAFGMVNSQSGKLNLHWSSSFSISLLKKSLPFAVLVLLMGFYNRLDSVMIERILGNGKLHAGIYAQGYRILDAVNMFAYLFASLLYPMFSRTLKTNSKKSLDGIEDLIKISYGLLIVPAIACVCIAYFYQNQIMSLLYTEYISLSAPIFGILMACMLGISTTYVYGTLLTANGNLKELNLMAFGGILLNISLNIILIPKFNGLGAAYASLATQLLTAVIQVALVQYIFRFKVNYVFMFKLALFGLLIVGFGAIISRHFTEWSVGVLLILIFSFASAIILRLVEFSSLMSIIKKRTAFQSEKN